MCGRDNSRNLNTVDGTDDRPIDDESRSLRSIFAERRLSVRTMDPPLRLATGGAAVSLIGAALLISLRDVSSSNVTLLTSGGVRTTLSTPLFVAALALLAVGFGYLATGAVLAHRLVGVLAVAVLTGGLGWYTGVLGLGLHAVLPPWAVWATRGLLLAIWLVAIGATGWRRHRDGDAAEDRALRLVLLVVYCAVFGGYLLILKLASPTLNGLSGFPGSVTVLMGGLGLLTVPILFVAAIDFGEWGQLIGRRLLAIGGNRPARPRVRRLLIAAILCVVLLVVAWTGQPGTVWHRLAVLTRSAVIFAVAVLVVVVVCRLLGLQRQQWPRSLSFAGVLVVAALIISIVPDIVGVAQGELTQQPTPEVSTTGDFTAAANVISRTSPTGSTMLVPVGWQVDRVGIFDRYTDRSVAFGAMILTIGHLDVGTQTLAGLTGLGVPLGPVRTDGTLQRLDLTPHPGDTVAVAWLEPGSKADPIAYEFLGAGSGPDVAGARLLLTAMVHSFRPPGTTAARIPATADEVTPTQAQQLSSDRFSVAIDGVLVVLAAIALLLLGGTARRWSTRARAALLLFCCLTMLDLVLDAGSIGRVLFGSTTSWPSTSQPGILAAIAVAGLVMLAIAARSSRPWAARLPAALTGLVGGVLALALVDTLYNHALAASRIAGWAAVIVLVAVAWDVTMSGESMTNRASRYVPRSSRVFLFLGYVILLACAVVFFSGQRGLGSGVALPEAIFEPESITRAGLFGIAMPLLVMLFLLHTFGATQPSTSSMTNHGPHVRPRIRWANRRPRCCPCRRRPEPSRLPMRWEPGHDRPPWGRCQGGGRLSAVGLALVLVASGHAGTAGAVTRVGVHLVPPGGGAVSTVGTASSDGLLSPAQLRTAYDVSPLTMSGYTGQGATVVFFETDGSLQTDLDAFAAANGLPQFTPVLVGGMPGPPADGGETPMDLEAVHGIAPSARLVVVNLLSFEGGSLAEVMTAAFRAVDRQFRVLSGASPSRNAKALTPQRICSPWWRRWIRPRGTVRRRSPPPGTPVRWSAGSRTTTWPVPRRPPMWAPRYPLRCRP